ncbi:MAG: hypothetical protein ACLGJB_12235, partial [Blastocatellia bacterium]
NAAPEEFGSGKTLHRYFQLWASKRVFKRMWRAGPEEYDEIKGRCTVMMGDLCGADRISR